MHEQRRVRLRSTQLDIPCTCCNQKTLNRTVAAPLNQCLALTIDSFDVGASSKQQCNDVTVSKRDSNIQRSVTLLVGSIDISTTDNHHACNISTSPFPWIVPGATLVRVVVATTSLNLFLTWYQLLGLVSSVALITAKIRPLCSQRGALIDWLGGIDETFIEFCDDDTTATWASDCHHAHTQGQHGRTNQHAHCLEFGSRASKAQTSTFQWIISEPQNDVKSHCFPQHQKRELMLFVCL